MNVTLKNGGYARLAVLAAQRGQLTEELAANLINEGVRRANRRKS